MSRLNLIADSVRRSRRRIRRRRSVWWLNGTYGVFGDILPARLDDSLDEIRTETAIAEKGNRWDVR